MGENPIEARSPQGGDLAAKCREFVTFFCRHLVCLSIEYVALDDEGRDVGQLQFMAG